MDRLIDDNGRLTTCQVVLGLGETILYGLATRLLQLFALHDHDILFVSCVCCYCSVFCSWSVLSRHSFTTNYELYSKTLWQHESNALFTGADAYDKNQNHDTIKTGTRYFLVPDGIQIRSPASFDLSHSTFLSLPFLLITSRPTPQYHRVRVTRSDTVARTVTHINVLHDPNRHLMAGSMA